MATLITDNTVLDRLSHIRLGKTKYTVIRYGEWKCGYVCRNGKCDSMKGVRSSEIYLDNNIQIQCMSNIEVVKNNHICVCCSRSAHMIPCRYRGIYMIRDISYRDNQRLFVRYNMFDRIRLFFNIDEFYLLQTTQVEYTT